MPSEAAQHGDSRVSVRWVIERAEVVAHAGRGSDWYKLTLRAPRVAALALAGHFVEVGVTPVGKASGFDPFLKRPLSICQVQNGELITVIYRALGRGTRLLTLVESGQQLEIMGPLGKSFPDPAAGQGVLVLVGGGLGIPPMALAAEWAHRQKGRPTVAICGARSADGLSGLDEVAAAGVPVHVVTDDGSAGRKALATEPLRDLINAEQVGEVWACGPEPMLIAVKDVCIKSGVTCWLSLERYMACGFGACIGCVVPKAQGPGYYKCCTDGPVFRAEEVKLGSEK